MASLYAFRCDKCGTITDGMKSCHRANCSYPSRMESPEQPSAQIKRTILWDEAAPSDGPTPRTVERMHCGLVDGLMRPKSDGAYVYYYDYQYLERALATMTAERDGLLASKRSVDEALNSGDGSYRP